MTCKLWTMLGAAGLLAITTGTANAAIVFGDDASDINPRQSFENAVPDEVTITWDTFTVPDGQSTTISPTAYAGLPGSPTLSDPDGALIVGDPDNDDSEVADFYGVDFVAASGENVYAPEDDDPPGPGRQSAEGVLDITFATPQRAIGAVFLDVQDDNEITGISIGDNFYNFNYTPGNRSRAFLGVIADDPFLTATIHMSQFNGTGGVNGVGIDDVVYATPLPGAASMGLVLLGGLGVLRKRRRRQEGGM